MPSGRPWATDTAARLGEASAAATVIGGEERQRGQAGSLEVRLAGSPARAEWNSL